MVLALKPLQACLLAALLAMFSLWCGVQSFAPPPEVAVTSASYTDIQLYQDIAAKVHDGTPYHKAARDLQNLHDYPTQPFVTVRLPTLAVMAATLGWKLLQALLLGVLLLAVIRWYRIAATRSQGEAIGVAVMVLAGGAMVTQPGLIAMHDFWAGVLTCAAMTFRGTPRWGFAIAFAGAAILIRELALPFALLALAFALFERRRNEAVGWAVLIGLFAVVMFFHAQAVHAVVLPTDKQSAPWTGLLGITGVLRDLTDTSVLGMVPAPLAYTLIPLALFGWSAAPRKFALFGLLYCLGIAAMIALFSRPDNFYWACLLQPHWFIGFAFLPRALRDLSQAALARQPAAL